MPTTTHLAPEAPLHCVARGYLDALLGGRRREAMQLVRETSEAGASVANIYQHVFEPTQREIGRLWEINAASVADEHYCTATTTLLMAQFWPRIMATPRVGRTAMCAAARGDRHELGLRMVGDFFEMAGWDVHYLGADLPARDTAGAVMRFEPDVLAIGASMAEHVPAAKKLIGMIRKSIRNPPKILVGGPPFDADPALWRALEADGYASSGPGGVDVAKQLVTR